MQITFDPLNEDEANFVARIVSKSVLKIPAMTKEQTSAIVRSLGEHLGVIVEDDGTRPVLAHADRPDVGATPEVPLAPSAAPLPPDAPSFAAVDLFPTVPAAPTASVPPAPPVPQPLAAAVPPAPPAPSAPAAPASPASAVELDKNGLPWDERIHAGTKAKNADGSWRQRRGLNDEALVKRVEAELRQLVANNATSAAPLAAANGSASTAVVTSTPSTAPVPSPTPTSTVSAPNAPPAPAAATASVPPPPVTPAGPPAVPAPPVPAGVIPPAPSVATPASTPVPPIDFAKLLDMMTKAIASQRLTEEQIDAELIAEGTDKTKLGLLVGDKDKTQSIGARLWNLLGGVV